MEKRPNLKHSSHQLQRLIGASLFDDLRKRFPKFRVRNYQVLAVREILRHLRSRSNVLFLLDPGLGKTIVSQLSYLALHDSLPRAKAKGLVLVPSRLLRDQHDKAAAWCTQKINVLNIDSALARYPGRLRTLFEKADWIIATPKLLSNAVCRDYGLRLLLKQLYLCVVDEFDAQAAEDVDSLGEPIGRFSEAGRELITDLSNNKTEFLCMSATQRAASAPWLKMFKMKRIDLPVNLVREYSAFARVTMVGVKDKAAIQADALLSLVILDTLRKIRHRLTDEFLTDPEIDPKRLYQQASRVFARKRHRIFSPGPIHLNVEVLTDSKLMALLGRFLRGYAERLALYEGRMGEVALQTYQRKARVNGTNQLVEVESVGEVDYSNFPTPNAKFESLRSILLARRRECSLILTRNTDVNDFIAQALRESGIHSASIVGTMRDVDRRKSLEMFEKGEVKILIVNRQIGGRGFDLPLARFAVFLSPKRSEETMWQEMLRIRSSHIDPKDVYILYFSQTREEEKTFSLKESMHTNGQRYEIRMDENSA